MPDEPENLVLHSLRAVHAKLDVIMGDVTELKTRVNRLEVQNASLHRSIADLQATIAEQSARMDRIDIRLLRIERRLDLVEAPST